MGKSPKIQISLRDTSSLTDSEMGQLLKTLASEVKSRSARKNKELQAKHTDQIEFLDRYRNLAQSVLSGPIEIDIDRPLEIAYQLFESMVSTIQVCLQEAKGEQKEETSRLLLA